MMKNLYHYIIKVCTLIIKIICFIGKWFWVLLFSMVLLLPVGCQIKKYTSVDYEFRSIANNHYEYLKNVTVNKDDSWFNKNPKKLLSYRFKRKMWSKNATKYCYANVFFTKGGIEVNKLKNDYKKTTLSNLEIMNRHYTYSSSLSLTDCLNHFSPDVQQTWVAPNYHYANGLLLRGSRKHLQFSELTIDSEHVELWVKDNRNALLVDKKNNIVKMVHTYWSCDGFICN